MKIMKSLNESDFYPFRLQRFQLIKLVVVIAILPIHLGSVDIILSG